MTTSVARYKNDLLKNENFNACRFLKMADLNVQTGRAEGVTIWLMVKKGCWAPKLFGAIGVPKKKALHSLWSAFSILLSRVGLV